MRIEDRLSLLYNHRGKRLLAFILLCCTVSLSGQNTWKFENYNYLNWRLTKPDPVTQQQDDTIKQSQSITLTGRQALTDKLGFLSIVTIKNNMGGGILGVDYSPYQWISLAALAGWDIPLQSVILMTSLVLKKGKTSFVGSYLYIGEVLNIYELALMYNTKYIKTGVIARNYFGVGPRVDIKLPGIPAYLWLAGLYEWETETNGLMIGLNLSLPERSTPITTTIDSKK